MTSTSGATAVKVLARKTRPPICTVPSALCDFLHVHQTEDLQEVDTACAGWWSNPDKAEAGGGLMTDMRSHNTADKLGPSKRPLWYHTWRTIERRRKLTEKDQQADFKETVEANRVCKLGKPTCMKYKCYHNIWLVLNTNEPNFISLYLLLVFLPLSDNILLCYSSLHKYSSVCLSISFFNIHPLFSVLIPSIFPLFSPTELIFTLFHVSRHSVTLLSLMGTCVLLRLYSWNDIILHDLSFMSQRARPGH